MSIFLWIPLTSLSIHSKPNLTIASDSGVPKGRGLSGLQPSPLVVLLCIHILYNKSQGTNHDVSNNGFDETFYVVLINNYLFSPHPPTLKNPEYATS